MTLGVGEVDLRPFLGDRNLIGSLDEIAQTGVLLVRTRVSALSSARPTHAATQATANAGNPHSDAATHTTTHTTVASHASGTAVLLTVLNRRTKFFTGVIAFIAIELPHAVQSWLRIRT